MVERVVRETVTEVLGLEVCPCGVWMVVAISGGPWVSGLWHYVKLLSGLSQAPKEGRM